MHSWRQLQAAFLKKIAGIRCGYSGTDGIGAIPYAQQGCRAAATAWHAGTSSPICGRHGMSTWNTWMRIQRPLAYEAWTPSGYSQMDPPSYPSAGDFFATTRCFLDCVIPRCVVMDAACQKLGRVLWKKGDDRLPDTAWNAKFQFTASDGNLALVGDLD